MKKFLAILAIAGVMVSCDNKGAEGTNKDSVSTTTTTTTDSVNTGASTMPTMTTGDSTGMSHDSTNHSSTTTTTTTDSTKK